MALSQKEMMKMQRMKRRKKKKRWRKKKTETNEEVRKGGEPCFLFLIYLFLFVVKLTLL